MKGKDQSGKEKNKTWERRLKGKRKWKKNEQKESGRKKEECSFLLLSLTSGEGCLLSARGLFFSSFSPGPGALRMPLGPGLEGGGDECRAYHREGGGKQRGDRKRGGDGKGEGERV